MQLRAHSSLLGIISTCNNFARVVDILMKVLHHMLPLVLLGTLKNYHREHFLVHTNMYNCICMSNILRRFDVPVQHVFAVYVLQCQCNLPRPAHDVLSVVPVLLLPFIVKYWNKTTKCMNYDLECSKENINKKLNTIIIFSINAKINSNSTSYIPTFF